MKACRAYGAGDLRLEELADPVPGPGQMLIRIAYGGICGSDLHYYHDGGVGDFTLAEPLTLGHEVCGTIAGLGEGVRGLDVGRPVAVHPATPCNACAECRQDRRHLCRHTRYLGSAALRPHVQGGLCELLVVPADQALPLPDGLDLARAALAEPLSVALHAVRRAGEVAGRQVLVTGAGPVGCLVVAVLRHRGAGAITVSDLQPHALQIARAVGADQVVRADVPADPSWPSEIDTIIEASGSPRATASALDRVSRGGRIVQLGMLPAGATPLAANLLISREISLVGAFRFDHEMDEAIRLLGDGLPVDPIRTHTFALDDAQTAFDLAGDRSVASKVLVDLQG